MVIVIIYIDTIRNNQTGVIYNRGGYLTYFGDNEYELVIYTEDDEEYYDYKLSFNFINKTGEFIRIK